MDILGRRDYFLCVLLACHTLPSVIGNDSNSDCTLLPETWCLSQTILSLGIREASTYANPPVHMRF